jgi:CHAD domain-containing protein
MKKVYEVHKHKSLKENLQKVLPEMFDDFFSLGNTVAGYPMRKVQLHEMRKAGKPLRYAMELGEYCFGEDFTKLLEEVKHVLELMGEIHDADVMIPELTRHINEIASYNRAVKESEHKISTVSLKDSVAKLRASRDEMFGELSAKLNEWSNGVFKSRIISSTALNTSQSG